MYIIGPGIFFGPEYRPRMAKARAGGSMVLENKKVKPMKQLLVIVSILLLPLQVWAAEFPLRFTDGSGKEITIQEKPTRVVSMVPSITEILMQIGAEDQVIGITYHSVLPRQAADKEIIGGFFRPDLGKVTSLQPDLIFYADLHTEKLPRLAEKAQLVNLSPNSIDETFEHIALLGQIFEKEDEAAAVIAEQQRHLELISKKVGQIPTDKRVRVMRLMGRSTLMAPGDDSFQNDYIRAAGGIAPEFGKDGNIISVSLDEWQQFNPQVVYGCGGDRKALTILDQPGWKDVKAVKNNRVYFFPCTLTCRAASHGGYFVSWLAARLYGDAFGQPGNFVLPEQVVGHKPVELKVDYVNKAEILISDIKDFRNKTVALHLREPMTVVSTIDGQKDNVTTVANHYFPPPSWGLGHKQGLTALRQTTLNTLGFDPQATAMLFTGANMDNLAVVTKRHKAMEVTALVTAGVLGNAVRMGADTGLFYEPGKVEMTEKHGTINIILLTNMQLSPRAMTRGIISATEGKSAALQDMDIRSSYSYGPNQATGTGTDNIIVLEGRGIPIDSSGGHTKMGELMARAVYDGVQQAVLKQNGVVTKRPVFQRLKERKVSLYAISREFTQEPETATLRKEVESLLLQPRYANFIKALMAISDDYDKGLVDDIAAVDHWCQVIAEEIAGKQVELPPLADTKIPTILGKGLSALYSGAKTHINSQKQLGYQ